MIIMITNNNVSHMHFPLFDIIIAFTLLVIDTFVREKTPLKGTSQKR